MGVWSPPECNIGSEITIGGSTIATIPKEHLVAVAGYRYFNNYPLFRKYMLCYPFKITGIIQGGCTGTDMMAKRYAKENNIPCYETRAKWEKYGNKAGPLRNRKMLLRSDALVAFDHDQSIGTKDIIRQAKKMKIPTIIYVLENSMKKAIKGIYKSYKESSNNKIEL